MCIGGGDWIRENVRRGAIDHKIDKDREFQVGITSMKKSDDKREWKQKVEKVFCCA